MNFHASLKPALFGAVAGAIAVAIIGFSWGGWVTGSKARQMSFDQSRTQVLAVLTPICIEQSSQDPELAAKVAQMKSVQSYARSDIVMDSGWATMPGSTSSNREVARACAEQLYASF